MFNFFKSREQRVEDLMQAIKDKAVVTPVIPKEVVTPVSDDGSLDNQDAEYTVGRNYAGNVQLRIKLEYGSATLTMSPSSTVQLIKQLAVNIDNEYWVNVAKKTDEEKTNV
jgi:hypothetical protein